MNKKLKLIIMAVCIVVASGCASVQNSAGSEPGATTEVATTEIESKETEEQAKGSPAGIIAALLGFALGLAVF